MTAGLRATTLSGLGERRGRCSCHGRPDLSEIPALWSLQLQGLFQMLPQLSVSFTSCRWEEPLQGLGESLQVAAWPAWNLFPLSGTQFLICKQRALVSLGTFTLLAGSCSCSHLIGEEMKLREAKLEWGARV